MSNSTAIVIPARYDSSRFPGKPLSIILGKSLIHRVWERCALAIPPEDVYVATDDDRIYQHCNELSIPVLMTSDQCLTGTDRVHEASQQINYKTILNVQGDEPIIDPQDILTVLRSYEREPDSVWCGMCPIETEEDFRSTSIPKVVSNTDGSLLYMSRAAIPTDKSLGFHWAMRQVCIYAFPQKALMDFGRCADKGRLERLEDIEILRFFDLGYSVKVVEVSFGSVAVDYPEDIAKVEKILSKQMM